MPASRSRPKRPSPKTEPQTAPEVLDFLRQLDHPHQREINQVRKALLAVSPDIREELKWNAPSFRTKEFFATFNLRAKEVQLVLHRGAKAKSNSKTMQVLDPEGLLEWRGTDRALLTLGKGREVQTRLKELQRIIAAWLTQL